MLNYGRESRSGSPVRTIDNHLTALTRNILERMLIRFDRDLYISSMCRVARCCKISVVETESVIAEGEAQIVARIVGQAEAETVIRYIGCIGIIDAGVRTDIPLRTQCAMVVGSDQVRIARKFQAVKVALHKLESREREVIQMRFGIGYDDCFTLDEIGKKFQLTRERKRQIEKKALTRLRKSKYATALKSFMEAC